MLVTDVLDALADRLAVVDGLTVTTDPSATIDVPMALATEENIEYNEAFGRGGMRMFVAVTVYVSDADSAEGMLEVRRYLSPHGADSVRAALENTADGVLSSVSVETGSSGVVEAQGGRFIAARFSVRVHVSNPDY